MSLNPAEVVRVLSHNLLKLGEQLFDHPVSLQIAIHAAVYHFIAHV